MSTVRPPAVAGMFYRADPEGLAAEVDARLARALELEPPRSPSPKALIAPHAGHRYSGDLAARAIALADPVLVRRVVLLGPIHHVRWRGMAIDPSDAWRTPLGDVPIDRELRERAAALPDVEIASDPHEPEHSLEVLVPFLQRHLGEGFTLLPVAVGPTRASAVARLLDAVWGGDETLILVSSDLSHYEPDAIARRIDAETLARILRLEQPLADRSACGIMPVQGLLVAAREHALRPELVGYATSADAPGIGDPSRVVGYAAIAFTAREATGDEPEASARTADPGDRAERPTVAADGPTAPNVDGDALTGVARRAIERALGANEPHAAHGAGEDAAPLPGLDAAAPGASFVTLTIDGALRGCIGTLEARRPLLDDVRENAVRAATRDPRFPALTRGELPRTRISVSVLGEPEPFPVESEADAIARLRPGVDGVLLEFGPYRGTFLPSVWESLPDPRDFLRHLKRKAGLPADWWDDEVVLSRYAVAEFAEPER